MGGIGSTIGISSSGGGGGGGSTQLPDVYATAQNQSDGWIQVSAEALDDNAKIYLNGILVATAQRTLNSPADGQVQIVGLAQNNRVSTII